MAWTKVSEKLYQVQIDGKYVSIEVPYGKARKLFTEFVGNGGSFDEEGTADIIALINQFGTVGDILLSKFGPKGEIVEEGDCHELSTAETIELFQVAGDIVSNFIEAISQAKAPQVAEPAAEVKPKKAPKA